MLANKKSLAQQRATNRSRTFSRKLPASLLVFSGAFFFCYLTDQAEICWFKIIYIAIRNEPCKAKFKILP